MITNRMPSPLSGPPIAGQAHPWAPQAGPATETAPGAHPLQQDGGSLSPEALQPDAQINELLAALTQAFAPPQQQLDPITQLKQEIQKVEQQLQRAQLTGNQQAVNSLERQLQQLNAQLQQLLGQQSEAAGGAESAPAAGAPAGGAPPVTASSPQSGNSSYGGGGGGGYSGGGGGGGGAGSGNSAAASPSFALDTNYSNTNAEPGVEKMLQRANSMVGLDENRDRAEIQKLTGKSGINPATTPWCAAFAMNLLEEHGVMNLDGLSNRNYCPTIKNWANDKGTYGKSGQYNPKPGDAILFDWEKDGTPDHIGIVEKVVNGKVHTIEGNSSNKVSKKTYDLNAGSIDGYVAAKPKRGSGQGSSSRS